jgi:hypothetical protein
VWLQAKRKHQASLQSQTSPMERCWRDVWIILVQIKACAKNRKIPFDLTQQEAWDLFLKQERRCALSGVTIAFAQNSKDLRDGKNTASIDRIDSNKPYTISNVQWVHYDVNYMKHWLSTEYFVNWCRLVVEHSSQHKCSLESV